MRLNPSIQRDHPDRVLQLPLLGNKGICGRWGNHLTFYTIASQMCRINQAELQTPPWDGEEWFDLPCKRIESPSTKVVDVPPLYWDGTVALKSYFHFPPRIIDSLVNRRTVQQTFRWKAPVDAARLKVAIQYRRYGMEGAAHWFKRYSIEQMVAAVEACGFPRSEITVIDEPQIGNTYNFNAPFIDNFLKCVFADHLFVYPGSSFGTLAGFLGNGRLWLDMGGLNFKQLTNKELNADF